MRISDDARFGKTIIGAISLDGLAMVFLFSLAVLYTSDNIGGRHWNQITILDYRAFAGQRIIRIGCSYKIYIPRLVYRNAHSVLPGAVIDT
jgi:hypothetical protein